MLTDASAGAAEPGHTTASVFCPCIQPPQPAPSTDPIQPTGASPAPTLTVQRHGDRITHIQIRCACGQLIELECDY